MCDALGAVEGDLQDPVVITGLGSARDGYSMEQGARSEEQVPEGDGDLVDFLDDEPVVVEDIYFSTFRPIKQSVLTSTTVFFP